MKLKNNQLVYIIIGLVVVLCIGIGVVVLTSKKDNSSNNSTSNSTNASSSVSQSNLETYTNKTYELSFQHPKEWSKLQTSDEFALFSIDLAKGVSLIVKVTDVTAIYELDGNDSNKYFESTMKGLKEVLDSPSIDSTFDLEKKETITIAEKSALKLIFTQTFMDSPTKVLKFYILREQGDKIYEYVFEYKARPANFDSSLAAIEALINTIKFTK